MDGQPVDDVQKQAQKMQKRGLPVPPTLAYSQPSAVGTDAPKVGLPPTTSTPRVVSVQGYLADKKQRPPRALQ